MKFFLIILLITNVFVKAQTTADKNFCYIVEIKIPIVSKKVVTDIEDAVKKHGNVTFFNYYAGNSPFCVLITSTPVMQSVFEKWLEAYKLQITFFAPKDIKPEYLRNRRLKNADSKQGKNLDKNITQIL
jgi:hypothetical protein